MKSKKLLALLLVLLSFMPGLQAQNRKARASKTVVAGQLWSVAKAQAWYTQRPWISGANFIPSTAINQLEMWQAGTFDPTTIDKELGWAEGIGFNTMRVFLHHLAWEQDKPGFRQRMDTYLTLAEKHHIQTIFVFFDDCWNKQAAIGTQPAPKTGIHNSGWVQDPGDPASRDSATFMGLKPYVSDVLARFGHDKRILMWDLYNEPGNSDKKEASLPLLRNVFAWARAANPDQPLTSGIWSWNFEKLNAFQVRNSDVTTYHDYEDPNWHERVIDLLKTNGRPLICTEYMARSRNSRFANIMPLLKKENVGAINWGLVEGKTNTKYAWDTPLADGSEPIEWFHEVFRKDGMPYRQDEVDVIRKMNGK